MPKYCATVHVSGLTGENPRAVRSALDEQLRQTGLPNVRVVHLDVDGRPSKPPDARASAPPASRTIEPGGLFLVAAAAWAVWFFWMMLSTGAE